MPPAERFIAPLVVLALHALLLADVACHRQQLLDVNKPLAAAEWAIAAAAVLAYLRTVISDPGFLRPKSVKSSRPWPLAALCPLAWFAAAGLRVAALFRGSRAATVGSGTGPGGTPSARDLRDVREVRELQPIGRSALDAMGGSEAGSDPGEETIDAADLEKAAVVPVASGGASDGDVTGQGGSLGAVPGSPRPGYGRKRANRWTASTARGGAPEHGDHRGYQTVQSGHRLRFCRVCSMHQPLRTKHCRDCGRCVRTHDHHCPWVGTCVGEGNRVYFYWFLVAQCIELITFFLEGVLALLQYGLDLAAWLNRSPGLVLGLVVMGLLLFMVSCLLAFHSYLAMSNMTTWENMSWHNISYLRSLSPEDGSPFSLSFRANLAVYCCMPWCPAQGCGGPAPVKRTEDGWAIWELGEPHSPLQMECAACGCGESGCNLCACFDAG